MTTTLIDSYSSSSPWHISDLLIVSPASFMTIVYPFQNDIELLAVFCSHQIILFTHLYLYVLTGFFIFCLQCSYFLPFLTNSCLSVKVHFKCHLLCKSSLSARKKTSWYSQRSLCQALTVCCSCMLTCLSYFTLICPKPGTMSYYVFLFFIF